MSIRPPRRPSLAHPLHLWLDHEARSCSSLLGWLQMAYGNTTDNETLLVDDFLHRCIHLVLNGRLGRPWTVYKVAARARAGFARCCTGRASPCAPAAAMARMDLASEVARRSLLVVAHSTLGPDCGVSVCACMSKPVNLALVVFSLGPILTTQPPEAVSGAAGARRGGESS